MLYRHFGASLSAASLQFRQGGVMADFEQAIAFVLEHEGSGYLKDAETGEESKYGVTRKLMTAIGLDLDDPDAIRLMTKEAAENFYHLHFWHPLRLSDVENQLVANKILDLAVNMGSPQAIKLAQRALAQYGCRLETDGVL